MSRQECTKSFQRQCGVETEIDAAEKAKTAVQQRAEIAEAESV